MDLSEVIGRIRWATIKRNERKSREKAYQGRIFCIKTMGDEIWKSVYPNNSQLEWKAAFTKYDACYTFFATNEGVKSDYYFLGEDEENRCDFTRAGSDKTMPYWTSEHIIAGNIIAQIKTNDRNPPSELVESILDQYFENQGIDAAGQALSWVHRLNSTVCQLYQKAPAFVEALNLIEQEDLNPIEAFEKAFDTTPLPDLPACLNSVDGFGRHNISYVGSCFYTIDYGGEAVCKEFPNERLNISDYETMCRVAYTIVKDIRNGDESGLGDALYMIKEEPEWKGECIMPQDREGIQNDLS